MKNWEQPLDSIQLKRGRPDAGSTDEDSLVDRVFTQYRATGFPYPHISAADIYDELSRLKKSVSCIDGVKITQNLVGLKIANAFHPERFRVRSGNCLTPLDVFENDDLFRKAIRKRIRYGDSLRAWGVLKCLCSASRTYCASNFRPTAARSIYRNFQARRVLDFCMGFGGRLLGAWDCVDSYIGIDAWSEVCSGNEKLLSSLRDSDPDCQTQFDLRHGCSEDVLSDVPGGSVDLVFTSPPYVSLERYGEEPTQSYLRHPSPKQWYDGFLSPCLKQCWNALVDGGHLVLNVNPEMVVPTSIAADREGFRFVEMFDLVLSSHQYQKKNLGVCKKEPVLSFRKDVN